MTDSPDHAKTPENAEDAAVKNNVMDRAGAMESRKTRWIGAILALAISVGGVAGCNESNSNTFRTTASDYLETGLNAIADGLIAGLFAVADTSSDTTTTGG